MTTLCRLEEVNQLGIDVNLGRCSLSFPSGQRQWWRPGRTKTINHCWDQDGKDNLFETAVETGGVPEVPQLQCLLPSLFRDSSQVHRLVHLKIILHE